MCPLLSPHHSSTRFATFRQTPKNVFELGPARILTILAIYWSAYPAAGTAYMSNRRPPFLSESACTSRSDRKNHSLCVACTLYSTQRQLVAAWRHVQNMLVYILRKQAVRMFDLSHDWNELAPIGTRRNQKIASHRSNICNAVVCGSFLFPCLARGFRKNVPPHRESACKAWPNNPFVDPWKVQMEVQDVSSTANWLL